MITATLQDEILFALFAPMLIAVLHIKIALYTFSVLVGLLVYKRPVVISLLFLPFIKRKKSKH